MYGYDENHIQHQYQRKRPRSQLDAKTITIPRIATSFPSITVELYMRGFDRNIFDPSEIFGELTLPKALMAPMIASCLPKFANM